MVAEISQVSETRMFSNVEVVRFKTPPGEYLVHFQKVFDCKVKRQTDFEYF